MKLKMTLVAVAVCILAGQAFGYTWYVNYPEGDDANDGYSWSTALDSITNALARLAATNAVEGNLGGHSILVTNGKHDEGSIDLTSSHNGADGNPNEIRAVGDYVRVDMAPGGARNYACMTINYGNSGPTVSNIVIEGLLFTYGYGTVYAYNCTNIVFRRVNFQYTGLSDQHMLLYSGSSIDITNCFFGFCGGDAIYLNNTGQINIKNCVIMTSQKYGVNHYSTADKTLIANCLFYGHNTAGMRLYNGSSYVEYSSHADVSTDRYFDLGGGNYLAVTNCVAKNPGFANRMGWDGSSYRFDAVYDNSPLLNAGEGGQDIGLVQNPTTVPTSSETYYVAQTGDDSDGLSWGTAWNTIGQAAAEAVAGDTVLVDTGTYSETITITNGGSDGLGVTYQAQGDVYIVGTVNMYGVSHVTLDGFDIDGGTAGINVDFIFHNSFMNLDVHDGAYGWDTDTFAVSNGFYRCDFRDNSNTGFYSYGMQYGPGNNVFRVCRFFNNADNDDYRGGVVVRSAGNVFERCQAFGNTSHGFYTSNNNNGTTRLYNCLSYSNGLDGIMVHYPCSIANCTVYANTNSGVNFNRAYDIVNSIVAGNRIFGIREGDSGDVEAKNCLFWDNGGALGETTNHLAESEGTYTNVFGTASDIDNVSPAGSCSGSVVADPDFVSVDEDNYRLKTGSAAIDAGDASLISTTLFPEGVVSRNLDLDGNTRVKMTAIDIGAYEWQPPQGTLFLVR